MNVWLIKHGETLPIQSGVRKMRTWALADALTARGHSVVWWTSTFSHQRKKLVAHDDSEVLVASNFHLKMLHAGAYERNVSLARILHHWRLGRKFRKSVDRMPKPDVIVCAYPVIDLADAAANFARERGIPLIVDVRDQWPSTFLLVCPAWMKPFVRIYVNLLLPAARRIFSAATRLVAMSEGCLTWAQRISGRKGDADAVFFIGFTPEGADTSGRAAKENAGAEEGLVCIYAGSLGAFYELPLVIKAARHLQNEGFKDIRFVIAGDGDQLSQLRESAADLQNVTFTGWVPSGRLTELLSAAHVGLLPYRDFGAGTFPNKPAEYFAHGLPVISSIGGEFALLIEKESLGLSYLPGDLDGLLAALKRMHSDLEATRRMGEGARRIFAERFDARRIYTQYADFIEKTVGLDS